MAAGPPGECPVRLICQASGANLWDDLWRVCVPSPMVSVVILQSGALTAGACAALLYRQKHVPYYMSHMLHDLMCSGVLGGW